MILFCILMIILAFVSIIFSIYAKKSINSETDVVKREELRSKYENISKIFGTICILMATIMIFTMF